MHVLEIPTPRRGCLLPLLGFGGVGIRSTPPSNRRRTSRAWGLVKPKTRSASLGGWRQPTELGRPVEHDVQLRTVCPISRLGRVLDEDEATSVRGDVVRSARRAIRKADVLQKAAPAPSLRIGRLVESWPASSSSPATRRTARGRCGPTAATTRQRAKPASIPDPSPAGPGRSQNEEGR